MCPWAQLIGARGVEVGAGRNTCEPLKDHVKRTQTLAAVGIEAGPRGLG